MPKRVLGLDADGLCVKEQRFVAEYRIDGDATRASRAAGYKVPANGRNVGQRGHQLLRRPRIAAALARQQAQAVVRAERIEQAVEAKAIITRERVEQFLADVLDGKHKAGLTQRLKAAEQMTRLNAYDKAPSSVIIPVIGIKIET